MRRKLLIFDLDGTLLNTIGDLTQAVNHALAQCGFSIRHSEPVIRSFVGNGISKLLERSLPPEGRDEATMQRMRSHFLSFYDQHGAEFTKPYPGVCELLHRLQQENYLLAIASNKYQQATEHLVGHYFPCIDFACIYGQRPDVHIKPHPQVVNEIIAKTGVLLSEVLYIGDSDVDMQTAHNAGVDAVGVSWGFRPRKDLETFSPVAIIDNAEDLLSVL